MRTLLLAAIFVVLSGLTVRAATPDPASYVTLSVSPSTISFTTQTTARVVVTARTANRNFRSITLSYFTDNLAKAAIGKPARSGAPPMGDVAWDVRVTPQGKGVSTGRIFFRADYTMENAGQLVPGVVISSLDIQERDTYPVEKIVSLELLSPVDTLQDDQSSEMYAVVKNLSRFPVTVHVTVSPIRSVAPQAPPLPGGMLLKPYGALPIAIPLKANSVVEPGKRLIVVKVDAEWEMDGQRRTGSLIASKDMKLGIFGESALLEATTIPSVILLPGFLFMVTFISLTQLSKNKPLTELDFKKPAFWSVSITLSLIAILFYKKVTGPALTLLYNRPMTSGDFLHGYGFTDIVRLWLGSVGFGFIFWAVGSSVKSVVNWYRHNLLTPDSEDPPLKILKKLSRNKKGFDLVEVRYPKEDAKPQKVFIFPSRFASPGKVWVIPRIRYRVDDEKEREFDRLTLNREDTEALVEKLEGWQNRQNSLIDLNWEEGAHLKAPEEVKEEEIQELGSSDPIFAKR